MEISTELQGNVRILADTTHISNDQLQILVSNTSQCLLQPSIAVLVKGILLYDWTSVHHLLSPKFSAIRPPFLLPRIPPPPSQCGTGDNSYSNQQTVLSCQVRVAEALQEYNTGGGGHLSWNIIDPEPTHLSATCRSHLAVSQFTCTLTGYIFL